MLNLDLNRLKIFACVYEELSVSKAAEKLYVTPSAVSQALGLLEKELSLRLFQRISRSIIPTAEARELYTSYNKCQIELNGCLGNLQNNKTHLSGRLKIGTSPEFGARQVTKKALDFFHEKDVYFELTMGLPDELIKKVISQEIDFAFCDDGPYLKNYKRLTVNETIFEEEAILVCSPHFYKTYVKKDHSFQHLVTLPHCDYRSDHKVLALWYIHHFGKKPSTLNCKLSAPQVGAMVQCALLGMGLVFIPKYLINEELKNKKLIHVTGKKKEYINPIILVQKADKVPSKLEKEFLSRFKLS